MNQPDEVKQEEAAPVVQEEPSNPSEDVKPVASTSFERVMASIPNPAITPASDDAVNDVDAVASRIAAAV
mgnify:CR=1 FL=1